MFHVPEQFRLTDRASPLYSDRSAGNNGAFIIKTLKLKVVLRVIAADGDGWEHCSVSLAHRTPHWDEMCFVKGLFWDPDDTVVQFHPPASAYVNCHPYTLHLWRPVGRALLRPPLVMV